jgi:hypothetical protein
MEVFLMNWIKVEDKLPEDSGTVLAWTNRGYHILAWCNLPTKQWLTDGDNLPLMDDFIVAWCEITEPNFVSDEEISGED